MCKCCANSKDRCWSRSVQLGGGGERCNRTVLHRGSTEAYDHLFSPNTRSDKADSRGANKQRDLSYERRRANYNSIPNGMIATKKGAMA